jgi:hypothetical protein
MLLTARGLRAVAGEFGERFGEPGTTLRVDSADPREQRTSSFRVACDQAIPCI